MFKVKPYPAVLEPTKDGYSIYFPDLPGAITTGEDYEEAIFNAEQCLSFHLYGMITDKEHIPAPSHMAKILKKLDRHDIAALIHPDIFAVKARQDDKAIRINITVPKSLLEAIDHRAKQLGIDRSKLLQKAAKEII